MVQVRSKFLSKHLYAKNRNSLAHRLLLYILLLSSCITLLITTLQLYQDYKEEVLLIDQRMIQIEKSYRQPK